MFILVAHLRQYRSILHDKDVYPEPSAFRPERFLDTQGHLRDLKPAEDPTEIAFGFGRRSFFL